MKLSMSSEISNNVKTIDKVLDMLLASTEIRAECVLFLSFARAALLDKQYADLEIELSTFDASTGEWEISLSGTDVDSIQEDVDSYFERVVWDNSHDDERFDSAPLIYQ